MSKENFIFPICVIGGGAAGIMAVLRCVLNNDEVLFFPGTKNDKRRSRAFWVSKVENMPGVLEYSKGIDGPNRDTLKWILNSEFNSNLHQKQNRGVIRLVKNEKDIFEITDDQDQIYLSKYVILCTGVMDIQPEFNGSIKPILPYANVQLADYCLRCDGHHVYKKNTSIICDGTDGGAWVAIMLVERYQCPSMTLLTNGAEVKLSSAVEKLVNKYNISIKTNKIMEVYGEPRQHILKGFVLDDNQKFETDICFISLGMKVYNKLAKDLQAKLDARGFVQTDQKGLSSVENLYVAGDLRAGIKKQIYTSWDSAVDSSDHINGILRAQKRNS